MTTVKNLLYEAANFCKIVARKLRSHEVTNMVKLYIAAQTLLANRKGQDLVEYALLAGSISMAAGAFLPQWVGPTVSAIFSKVTSCMQTAGG